MNYSSQPLSHHDSMKRDVAEFIERIIEDAGFELSVKVEDSSGEPGDLRVLLAGPDRGLLLGRNA